MSELARIAGKSFTLFTFITSHAVVKLERYEFAAAPIFYAFGIMFSLIIFPPATGYASIATLTLGDGFAALFGGKFGKTQFPFNKAKYFEGSLFGFIFAFLGANFFLNPIRAFIGAMIGMLVECLPLPINDNLTIPLISGAALTLTFI
jgi:dolichol kinase